MTRSSAKNEKYEKMAMVGCVVLSHGRDKDMIRTKDSQINMDEIIKPYRNNKKLARKPKLFIIQACRGDKYMPTVNDCTDGPNTDGRFEEEQRSLQLTSESEFLFAHYTVSGGTRRAARGLSKELLKYFACMRTRWMLCKCFIG